MSHILRYQIVINKNVLFTANEYERSNRIRMLSLSKFWEVIAVHRESRKFAQDCKSSLINPTMHTETQGLSSKYELVSDTVPPEVVNLLKASPLANDLNVTKSISCYKCFTGEGETWRQRTC